MHTHALEESKASGYFIKYRADIGRKYKNLTVSLLIEQLEFWFSKQTKKNKFYKFIAPPCQNHYRYREGDSWCEELGITPEVFRRAFKKIGIAYKSYTLYEQASDKFQDFPYASYYNRQSRQTFFIKNHAYKEIEKGKRNTFPNNKIDTIAEASVSDLSSETTHQDISNLPSTFDDAALSSCLITAESDDTILSGSQLTADLPEGAGDLDSGSNTNITNGTNLPKGDNDNPTQTTSTRQEINNDSSSPEKGNNLSTNPVSRKTCFKGSPICAFNYQLKKHSISFKEKEFVDKLFFQKDKKLNQDNSTFTLEKSLGKQMIAIWRESVGDPRLSFTSEKLLINLYTTLEQHFQASLFEWKAYCHKIASSKFLMGEGSAWKLKEGVYLLWAIKEENITKIKTNALSLGDRKIKLSSYEEKLNLERVHLYQEIKQLENESETVRKVSVEVQQLRARTVKQQMDQILNDPDGRQLRDYQNQFEKMIQQGSADDLTWKYASCTQSIKNKPWREMNREGGGTANPWWYFTLYLTHILADQHFGMSEQHMIEQKQEEIRNQLKHLREKLAQLNLTLGLN